MIVVDTSAVIAILRREPEVDVYMRAIAAAERRLISAVSVLEAAMVIAGTTGGAGSWGPLDALVADVLEVVPFDADQEVRARQAFVRFGRGRHPAALNFGDCAAYALAATRGAPLLFKGADFTKTDLTSAL